MSIPQQTVARLRELRLQVMARAYEAQLEQPSHHNESFDDRFAMLVEQTAAYRESAKLHNLVKKARFPETASIEQIDFRANRGVDKSQITSLATCEWIRRQQNMFVLGATGVGKTWIACAFGMQACRSRLSTSFYKAADLWERISNSEIDGSLKDLKAELVKFRLLIIDDFGIGDISPKSAMVFFDVIDRRMKSGSLLITSQYPTDKWHGFFPDPTVADALLDRIVHASHRLQLKGESMRKLRAREQMANS